MVIGAIGFACCFELLVVYLWLPRDLCLAVMLLPWLLMICSANLAPKSFHFSLISNPSESLRGFKYKYAFANAGQVRVKISRQVVGLQAVALKFMVTKLRPGIVYDAWLIIKTRALY